MFQDLLFQLVSRFYPQGRQDCVAHGLPWISPDLWNHGISTGKPACKLNADETNLLLLYDEEKMQQLMQAIEEDRVMWKYPEETAIPHLWCLMQRGDEQGALALRCMIGSLECSHRIRFFPRIVSTPQTYPVFTDQYVLVSDITTTKLKEKLKTRAYHVKIYIANLQFILKGFNFRRDKWFYAFGTHYPENKESVMEAQRLTLCVQHAELLHQQMTHALDWLQTNPHHTLTTEHVELLTGLCPSQSSLFKRALQTHLKDLDLHVEEWAKRVSDYTATAASPTLSKENNTPLEQKLTNILFVLSEHVAKAFLIGCHRRINYASYPWHIPVANPQWSAKDEVRLKVKEILTWFVTKFPGYSMPNPLVQTIHALLESTGDTDEIYPLKIIAQVWGVYSIFLG